MAKTTGIQNQLQVDDSGGTPRDISGSVNSYSLSTPRGVFDVTGLDKSAIERLLGLADAQLTINGTFDVTTDAGGAADAHEVFKDVGSDAGTTARTVILTLATAGGAVASDDAELTMEMVLTEYSLSRGNDGNMTYTATLMLQSGTAPTWSVKA